VKLRGSKFIGIACADTFSIPEVIKHLPVFAESRPFQVRSINTVNPALPRSGFGLCLTSYGTGFNVSEHFYIAHKTQAAHVRLSFTLPSIIELL
jgi:hypothetical protein